MKAVQYQKLFSSIRINSLTVKNRIAMPAMNTNFADLEGYITDRLIRYYAERAKGGVGLIIISSAYIDARARKRRGGIAIYDDRYVPRLKELSTEIKKSGAVVLQQLNHNGRLLASSKELKTNLEGPWVVAPSAIPHRGTGLCSRELTLDEIQELIEKFCQAAMRAKDALFDGVELHGAHGYLLGQFLSPYSNRRKDAYGGDLSRRMRFPLEITERVRAAVGSEMLISYRMSATEFEEKGLQMYEAQIFAQELQKRGVNLIHVTGGINETPETMEFAIPFMSSPQDRLYRLAKEIKAVVSIPVMAVGRIDDPDLAERILEEEGADLVAIGRGLICDPLWANKAKEGKTGEIRKCIACNQGCIEMIVQEKEQTCLLNPGVGREGLADLEKRERAKKVLVVGGGPAGMEVAMIAATRGHQVTLCEKEGELGGQIILAAKPPGKDNFERIRNYFIAELERLGVAVILDKEVRAEDIEKGAYDAIILATGSEPIVPMGMSAIDSRISQSWEVLRGKQVVGRVIVIGGGLVGVETALFLEKEKKKVTIVEMQNDILKDVGPLTRARLKADLREKGINVILEAEVLGIQNNVLRIRSKTQTRELSAESIVWAVGVRSRIYPALEGKAQGLFKVGDCVTPRKMIDAIREGYEIGVRI